MGLVELETTFDVEEGIRMLLLWYFVSFEQDEKLVKKERCSFVCSMFLELVLLWMFARVQCLGNSYLERGSSERRDGRLLLRVWASWSVGELGIGCRLQPLLVSTFDKLSTVFSDCESAIDGRELN